MELTPYFKVLDHFQGPNFPHLTGESDFYRWHKAFMERLRVEIPEIRDFLTGSRVFNDATSRTMNSYVESFLQVTVHPMLLLALDQQGLTGKALYQVLVEEHSKLRPQTQLRIWASYIELVYSSESIADILDFYQSVDPKIFPPNYIPIHIRSLLKRFPIVTEALVSLFQQQLEADWQHLDLEIRRLILQAPSGAPPSSTEMANFVLKKRKPCPFCEKVGHAPPKCWYHPSHYQQEYQGRKQKKLNRPPRPLPNGRPSR